MQSDLEGLLTQIEEARREWQAEMEQAQQIFRDLLATISELSGVELPAMAIDDQREGNTSLRIGFKTLKDRIRNDLESYSAAAAAEVGKTAHTQGKTILEPLRKEMDEQLDSLTEEFRAKMQQRLASGQDEVAAQARANAEEIVQTKMGEFGEWLKFMSEAATNSVPEKVEKAVEPHIREVSERLKASFQQQLHFVLQDQEKSFHEKARELHGEIEAQINKLGEETRQASQQQAEKAAQALNERLEGLADEAVKKLDAKAEAGVERNLGHFRQRMGELTSSAGDSLRAFADQQADTLRQKLQEVTQELQQKSTADISANIDKITKETLDSSLQHLRGQMESSLEASKGELKANLETHMQTARQQMNDMGQSTRDSFAHEVTELSEKLKTLSASLEAAENERLAAAKENLARMTQTSLDSVAASLKQTIESEVGKVQNTLQEFQGKLSADNEQRFREAMDARLKEGLAQLQAKAQQTAVQASAEVQASSDQVIHGLTETVNKEVNTATSLLKDWARQTTAWAESTIKNSLETYRGEIAQLSSSVLERQRQTIHESFGDLQDRLEQAASILGNLNGKQPEETNNEAA